MTDSRRAKMSDIMKAKFAALPKDATCRKCGEPIVSRFIFCRDCWLGMTDDQRLAINSAFVAGTKLREQPDPAYWAAVDGACK
jgi:hypothetical protein